MKKIIVILFLSLSCCKTDKERRETTSLSSITYAPIAIINKEGIALKVYDYKNFEGFLKRSDENTYIINFWATWCKPCIEELSYFEKLHKNYKDKGVKVILVSLDMPNTIEKQLLPFIKKEKLQAEVILLDDPKQNDWISKIDANWSGAIPATLIYTKDKKAFFEKSFSYEELQNQVLTFLN